MQRSVTPVSTPRPLGLGAHVRLVDAVVAEQPFQGVDLLFDMRVVRAPIRVLSAPHRAPQLHWRQRLHPEPKTGKHGVHERIQIAAQVGPTSAPSGRVERTDESKSLDHSPTRGVRARAQRGETARRQWRKTMPISHDTAPTIKAPKIAQPVCATVKPGTSRAARPNAAALTSR